MELTIDELENRLSVLEEKLTSAVSRISYLEEKLKKQSSTVQFPSQQNLPTLFEHVPNHSQSTTTSHQAGTPTLQKQPPTSADPGPYILNKQQPQQIHQRVNTPYSDQPPLSNDFLPTPPITRNDSYHVPYDNIMDEDVPPLPPPIKSSFHQRKFCDSPAVSMEYKQQAVLQNVGNHINAPLQPTQLSQHFNLSTSPNPLQYFNSTSPNHPQCFLIQGQKRRSLPSVEINKENLLPSDVILKRYPSLHKENVIGKLAVKLAKESFFGEEILRKCTVMGCRQHPSLPTPELNQLKQAIFSVFPSYWDNPVEFESKIWNVCVNSIGQLCKRLRKE